jgi:general stress protein 26
MAKTKKRSGATIRKVARLMRDLDICMMTTHTARGGLRARPMSNNGEVEFDGDVWFFSEADSRKVREIEATPKVHLAYADLKQWRFVSMSGRARIVRDPAKKQELWLKELERWFKDGPESEDIVLIKVSPALVSYWTKSGDGELALK